MRKIISRLGISLAEIAAYEAGRWGMRYALVHMPARLPAMPGELWLGDKLYKRFQAQGDRLDAMGYEEWVKAGRPSE